MGNQKKKAVLSGSVAHSPDRVNLRGGATEEDAPDVVSIDACPEPPLY